MTKWKVGTDQHLLAARFSMLLHGSTCSVEETGPLIESVIGQWTWLNPVTYTTFVLGNPPPQREHSQRWRCTAQCVGAAGSEGGHEEELCVLEWKMLDREVIMSVSKLAWLTHRKAAATSELCK